MYDDEVCNVVGFARLHQRSDLMVSSVHALRSRKHQFYLLRNDVEVYCVNLSATFPPHLYEDKLSI